MSEVSVTNEQFSVERQKQCFERGTQYVKLLRAAMANSGIRVYGREDRQDYIQRFEEAAADLSIAKFVPASGAATRMFKRVFLWISDPKKHNKEIKAFFEKAEQLPFFNEWMEVCNEQDIETYAAGINSKVAWLKVLVEESGVNMASKPKGIVPFHIYKDHTATPIEEHISEAIGLNGGKKTCVHFTISEEHRSQFEGYVSEALKNLSITEDNVRIEFSVQNPDTDTIVMDVDGEPIRIDGDLARRPGGHGALITNLNEMDADLIFIKNIDNVNHSRYNVDGIKHKKLLGGVLLDLRADLKRIHDQLSKGLLDEVSIDSAREKWGLRIPRDYVKVKEYLKRPLRVCGMVKNEGEPGGGPFWTLDKYTGESLQIVEQAQIDVSNMRQEMILKSATHFNPVDLVCSTKGLDGQKINLMDYIDEDQYFIAKKTLDERDIHALEWPGLWNGAMAHWVTIFVEVPITTFNPVKELTDLLRKNHTAS